MPQSFCSPVPCGHRQSFRTCTHSLAHRFARPIALPGTAPELRGGPMMAADGVPVPRRNIELVLLLLALSVGIGANALVGVDQEKAFDSAFWFQSSLLA